MNARWTQAQSDPLPSWTAGETKRAIVSFVTLLTSNDSSHFVPPDERIAVFDNDGTLWSEQPFYFQLAFALDQIRAQADADPELARTEPYKSVLSGDPVTIAASGEKKLAEILSRTHAGMTASAFEKEVQGWVKSARHPRFDRSYTDLVFQPMLELLDYLRANGFKTYIVSGGGTEFMRPWIPEVYGIPPEQIIGSSGKAAFEISGNEAAIRKLPGIDFVDDGPGKPVAIHRFIGRRPILAAGNSDGDLEMLQWTAFNRHPYLALIVHHTDAEREWAYDRNSLVGRLDKAVEEAERRGWPLIDMKEDWKVIYPFQK